MSRCVVGLYRSRNVEKYRGVLGMMLCGIYDGRGRDFPSFSPILIQELAMHMSTELL